MNIQINIEKKRGTSGSESRTLASSVTSASYAAPRVVILGRHIDCDLRLDSDEVSRQHARLVLGSESFAIEDLSSNGTAVSTGDILRHSRAFFAYGTQLEVGPYRITVQREAAQREGVEPERAPRASAAPQGPGPSINSLGASTPSRGVAAFGNANNANGGLGVPRHASTPSTSPSGSQALPTVVASPARIPSQHPQAQQGLLAQAPNVQSSYPPPVMIQPHTSPSQPIAVVTSNPITTMPPPQLPGMPPPLPNAFANERANDIQLSEEVVGLRRKIHAELLKNLDFAKIDPNVNDPSLRPRVLTALKRIVRDIDASIPTVIDRDAFIGELLEEALGLGPLEPLLADPSVTEVMVVDPATIYVERAGKLEITRTRFTDEERVRAVIERIVTPLGRRIDESQPLVDARLPDGSRVNAIIRPLALRGSCITIRRFPKKRLMVEDFIRLGSLTPRIAKFLERSVIAKKNILISGGTGSGKTTLLNVLSASIPSTERIVTIEDAAELQLHQPHVVSLETKHANMEGKGAFTIRDLVKNSLRMRPDRIVVGECRGGEALDMLQAMNTGHDGSLTTIHANSPVEALSRLETLVLMAGVDLPSHAIREQIARSIHVIVQQSRMSDGSRKITHVSEIDELDPDGRFEVRPIFEFEQTGVTAEGKVLGDFEATGYLPSFLDEMMSRGLVRPGEPFL